MSKASDKMSKSRAGLILDQPFFGSLALRLSLVEDSTNNPTAMVNGKEIRYNPEFINGLSLEETKGLICHEIMHCANQHHTRRDNREMKRWNVACDYAINPLILGCGMALPKGGLVDSGFADMSAEQIFSKLPDSNPGGGGEDEGNDPGKCGGVEDLKDGKGNGSESEKSQAEQDWKVAVAQAAQQAKAMGLLPGILERLVSDMIEPVLNWKDLLRRFVDTSAKNDYQWFPPNRRYVHSGLLLPSLRSQELKNITLAMDTSGSITDDDLKAFEAEVRAIVEDYRANATVIYCDSMVRKVEQFNEGDPVELHPVGGGGTDFRPPFQHIEESGDSPVCMVYQTDGECNRFPAEPPYPVLWVLTRKNRGFCPPFGEVVTL